MKHLKKNIYYSREDFIRHISTITLGRFAYDGSPVSFLEVAAYLDVSPDSLRMRKRDANVMKTLEAAGIKVKKIKGINHYYLTTEEENTLII
ncbi:hypothetical protein [Bacillus sp. UMB0893]|uniref:hypothetical protein n=1 Tax=Bacillus sp. UMB0893 TaxID=2066053 RepID=UPI000C78B973|nr:hypothetical protein [Bacillus sp. UMB0893]PLR69105.1 hypothetical protein CYJ36_01195 [Bacillus sp. UMB0893]